MFDSVNYRKLLAVDEYFPGAVLPPHLSPFVQEEEGDYVPPERQAMLEQLDTIKQPRQEGQGYHMIVFMYICFSGNTLCDSNVSVFFFLQNCAI